MTRTMLYQRNWRLPPMHCGWFGGRAHLGLRWLESGKHILVRYWLFTAIIQGKVRNINLTEGLPGKFSLQNILNTARDALSCKLVMATQSNAQLLDSRKKLLLKILPTFGIHKHEYLKKLFLTEATFFYRFIVWHFKFWYNIVIAEHNQHEKKTILHVFTSTKNRHK